MNTALQNGPALPPDIAASVAAIEQQPDPANTADTEAQQAWLTALDAADATADLARTCVALGRAIAAAYADESRARQEDGPVLIQLLLHHCELRAVGAGADAAAARARLALLSRSEGGAS